MHVFWWRSRGPTCASQTERAEACLLQQQQHIPDYDSLKVNLRAPDELLGGCMQPNSAHPVGTLRLGGAFMCFATGSTGLGSAVGGLDLEHAGCK